MTELNAIELGQAIRSTRLQKGWTQQQLAQKAKITRSALAKYELGQRKMTTEQMNQILDCLLGNSKNPHQVEGIIDYLTIHFFSTNYKELVKEVLGVSMKHMIFSEITTLGYTGRFNLLNAIDIRISNDTVKGTLFELKGKGCRFLSGWLKARKETWPYFIQKVFAFGGNFTRIDFSMNDYEGLLDLPKMAKQVENNYFYSTFKRGDIYNGKNLTNGSSDGTTLYFGSPKSQLRFCFYQKNYEQRRKNGTPLEDSSIINRYELRFRHEKAQELANYLLSNKEFETIIFELMNHSLCFYDRTPRSPNAKIDKDWANFIGNHGTLQISLPSNPMSLEKSIRWLIQNVSPTMKLIDSIGNIYNVDLLGMIVETGKLSEDKQKMLNTIKEQPEWFKEEIDVYTKKLIDKQKKQSTAYTVNSASILRPRQVEYTTFCSTSQQIKEEV